MIVEVYSMSEIIWFILKILFGWTLLGLGFGVLVGKALKALGAAYDKSDAADDLH